MTGEDVASKVQPVHHEGQQRMDQAVEVAKLVHKGDITSLATEQLVHTKLDDHATRFNKVTKEVMEILAPLEESEIKHHVMIIVSKWYTRDCNIQDFIQFHHQHLYYTISGMNIMSLRHRRRGLSRS